MIIDAHQHFWRLARGDYPWPTPDLVPIYRDFAWDDLAPHLDMARIDATILVQAAPSEAETHYLLDLAADQPRIKGVVGWVDFDAPDVEARIEALAKNKVLLGLRPMLQGMADTGWINRAQNRAPLAAMARGGLRLDALIQPRHLSVMLDLTAAHPELPVVIDHGAKPYIASGEIADWARDMGRIGRETAFFCKLSGLVTEAAPGWTVQDLKLYVDVLLEAFGPERLMWGSDWPVVNLNGDYATWRAASLALIGHLSPPQQALILGGTAVRFYGLTTS